MGFTVVVRLKGNKTAPMFTLEVNGPQEDQAEAEKHAAEVNPRLEVITGEEATAFLKQLADKEETKKKNKQAMLDASMKPSVQAPPSAPAGESKK